MTDDGKFVLAVPKGRVLGAVVARLADGGIAPDTAVAVPSPRQPRSATSAAHRHTLPLRGADCPVVVAYRVSWPDEKMIHGTLADIRAKVKASGITRTALILVGQALGEAAHADSRLYDPAHHHVLRPTGGA